MAGGGGLDTPTSDRDRRRRLKLAEGPASGRVTANLLVMRPKPRRPARRHPPGAGRQRAERRRRSEAGLGGGASQAYGRSWRLETRSSVPAGARRASAMRRDSGVRPRPRAASDTGVGGALARGMAALTERGSSANA